MKQKHLWLELTIWRGEKYPKRREKCGQEALSVSSGFSVVSHWKERKKFLKYRSEWEFSALLC